MNAGDIAHQLARRERPLLFGIRADVLLHRRIEIDAPPVVKQGHGGGRQRFRDAAKTEPRERRHRCAALDVGPAEALGPHQLAIHRDGNREARQVLLHDERAGQAPRFVNGARVPSRLTAAAVDGTAAGSVNVGEMVRTKKTAPPPTTMIAAANRNAIAISAPRRVIDRLLCASRCSVTVLSLRNKVL